MLVVDTKQDFTITQYKKLLNLAKQNFSFVTYDAIPSGSKFILWRHDLDISLNRALDLAHAEADYGVRSTYFLDPHCTFYNLAEKSQFDIVKKIMLLGHSIGLHFDSDFYGELDGDKLVNAIHAEKIYIEQLFGTKLSAFSFHNPSSADFQFDKDSYAGLINCYSHNLRNNVAYCSDSNGMWRHKNLQDFVSDSTINSAQVLTHPGWWQTDNMVPRTSVARAVTGRRNAMALEYDDIQQNSLRFSEIAEPMYRDFLPLLKLRKIDLDCFEV